MALLTGHASAQQRSLPSILYGVTIDNIAGLSSTAAAIHALPKPIIARVVFDMGESASYYAPAIQQLDGVGYTMGQILDSSDEASISVSARNARTDAYLAALAGWVDVWEVGNEVNGNWLGPIANTAAKIYYAWKQAHGKGYRTALTLYYDDPCPSGRQWRMLPWAQANVPADMKGGLDYVLVSYYPAACNGVMPSTATWVSVFQQLAAMFPRSKVGFGEIGSVNAKITSGTAIDYSTPNADEPTLDSIIRTFYGLTPALKAAVPSYAGGYFTWYFKEQSVPSTKPSWQVLANTIGPQ